MGAKPVIWMNIRQGIGLELARHVSCPPRAVVFEKTRGPSTPMGGGR